MIEPIKNKNFYLQRILLYIFLTTLLIITITPFLIMVITSFKTTDNIAGLRDILPSIETFKNFKISRETFKNYIEAWNDGMFGKYFYNTIIVTLLVILGNLIFDTMVAYALSRKEFYGKKLIFLFILARMMIPVQVLIIPVFILIKQLNLYDTLTALILPNVVQGFGIFLMKQYFDGIPKSLDEAAIIDGASDFQILRYILFPIAKPAIAVLIINTALSTWNIFLMPLILTQSVEKRVLGLGLALYKSQYGVDYVHSMAASTIAVLPILILFLCFQNYIVSGLTKGAVKT
ncbi:MAG TPA: carbohydrate ABC transporter permease [bacterium]|nr:carbohydrate ABC transporter permease [bacterium]